MKTFYLIDFENVHEAGLEGLMKLLENDKVIIFATKNDFNAKISLKYLRRIDSMKLEFVPKGNQSLDKHLISYLGFLIGKNKRKKQCAYVIVSKDTGYDSIIKYWKTKGYKNISRREKISNEQTSAQSNDKKESQARLEYGKYFEESNYVDNKEEIMSIIVNGQTKCQINCDLMKLLRDGKAVKAVLKKMDKFICDLPVQ